MSIFFCKPNVLQISTYLPNITIIEKDHEGMEILFIYLVYNNKNIIGILLLYLPL